MLRQFQRRERGVGRRPAALPAPRPVERAAQRAEARQLRVVAVERQVRERRVLRQRGREELRALHVNEYIVAVQK
jgi:hypothetical protein